jgi:hypothetical protein
VDEPQDEPFEEPVAEVVDGAVDEGADELFSEQVDEPSDELSDPPSDAPSDPPAEEPVGPRSSYEPTGNPEVDDVLERVSQVADLPTSEHVEVYEDAHRQLHETLVTAVDEPERPHGG